MRTCLIVGASGAIGSAATQHLMQKGWNVLRSTSQPGREGFECQIDFLYPDRIASAVKDLPNVDAVVVSAGREPQRSLAELRRDHLDRMIAIHVAGPLLLLQAIEEKLNPDSAVVLISSVAAYRGSYDPAYAAAKGAVISLTRSLSRAWSPRTRVNAIAPSLVNATPASDRMTEDFRERHLSSTPLGRLLNLQECAEAIEFLLSHRYLTGVVLHLNGGQYYG